MKKTVKTCAKEVVAPSKCTVQCAAAKPTAAAVTAAPKAVGVQSKGVLGLPTETWVGLLGKVITTVVNKQGPIAAPSAAPSVAPSVSVSNGGDGGDGGAGPDGGDGGAGGAGGDAVVSASPAARFDF